MKNNAQTRVTLYHLEGFDDISKAIKEFYINGVSEDHNFKVVNFPLGNVNAILTYGTVSRTSPKWSKTVTQLTGTKIDLESATPSAVIVFPDIPGPTDAENRPTSSTACKTGWAVTFGMGFQMLDQRFIDTSFGQRVAIRCAESDSLSTIRKTTLDDRPQTIRSTIPGGASLQRFEFDGFSDFVTKIDTEASIPNLSADGHPIKVRGGDSLNLPMPTTPETFLKIIDNIKTILKKQPISEELAALENLTKVRNKETINELNTALAKDLSEKQENIGLNYPYELIEQYGQAGSYKITGRGRGHEYDDLPTLETIISAYKGMEQKGIVERISKEGIILFSGSETHEFKSSKIPLIRWLSYQTTIADHHYFLQNGTWYKGNNTYLEHIYDSVREIFSRVAPISDFPDWNIKQMKNELKYNEHIAREFNGICLDRQLIRPDNERSSFEACDVLLEDGVFVHVKNASSSAPISHLLAQAFVSTNILLSDETTQDKLQEIILQIGKNQNIPHNKIKNFISKPKRVIIVLARDKSPITADSLFTFSKVNLVRQDQIFKKQGIDFNVISTVRRP